MGAGRLVNGAARSAAPFTNRPAPIERISLRLEQALWERDLRRVVGVDEVGLGSLCGPVIAAAVRIPVACQLIDGVRDSKLVLAARREQLADEIRRQATGIGIGAASVAEIERLNVRRASHLAMKRALARVGPYDHALIDGKPIQGIELGPHTTIVDGDASSYAIACASIIAKVARDRLMKKLAVRYPAYGWDHNAGYGTSEHLAALKRFGLTPHHRLGYEPVRAILIAQSGVF